MLDVGVELGAAWGPHSLAPDRANDAVFQRGGAAKFQRRDITWDLVKSE